MHRLGQGRFLPASAGRSPVHESEEKGVCLGVRKKESYRQTPSTEMHGQTFTRFGPAAVLLLVPGSCLAPAEKPPLASAGQQPVSAPPR